MSPYGIDGRRNGIYPGPSCWCWWRCFIIVGKALKASQDVKDKHIPLILGGAGVFLAMLWVVATGSFDGVQSIALGLFTGIVQGVLVAGCSVYANQLVKQAGRAD